jgi:hypothetical protein
MCHTVRSSPRVVEIVLAVALVGGGVWLRWHHLGTPSLWWDELVHVRTAERESVAEVWRTARDGVVPGRGNAGAVPLDYLVLHAWLDATPRPSPDAFERHYRIPAFAYAVAALPLMWLLARSVGGAATGMVALALLATSIPHVLYAAEARFYSLSVLTTLANLAAFAALVRAPSAARLAVFTAVGIVYVLSSLYGLFPLAAEHVVLALLAWRGGARVRVAGIAASGLAVALVLFAWLGPGAFGAGYGRGVPPSPAVASAISATFDFFAGSVATLAATFGIALLAAPIAVRRDRVAGALAAVCLLSACAIPAMVEIAYAKQYYYHPRHALFLLPMAQLAAALVAGRMLDRWLRAPSIAALVGAAVVLAVTATSVRAYVADPLPYFRVTKTLRDFRGLTQALVERTAVQAPDARLLLVLEQRRPGHLANPTLAFYLEAYGIADRVMLAGVPDPQGPLAELARRCSDGCRGPMDYDLIGTLALRDPFDQPPLMRRLLRIPVSAWATSTSGVALVTWAPTSPQPPPGLVAIRLDGLTLFEPPRSR